MPKIQPAHDAVRGLEHEDGKEQPRCSGRSGEKIPMIPSVTGGKLHVKQVDQKVEERRRRRIINEDDSEGEHDEPERQGVREPLQLNAPPLKQGHKDANWFSPY